MIKRALIVAVSVVALFALAAPAWGQQYPPGSFFVTVSDTTVVPGQTITITAGTFGSGTTVSVAFFSQPVNLGSATAGANGTASLSATIPADATTGAHTITATGTGADGAPVSVSTTVTVVEEGAAGAGAAGAGGAAGDLPRTGDDSSLPLARIAAALVAVGGGLLFVTRRRRAAAAA